MGNTTENKTEQKVVVNRQVKDNGAKLIFKDPILCAEFLRGEKQKEYVKSKGLSGNKC